MKCFVHVFDSIDFYASSSSCFPPEHEARMIDRAAMWFSHLIDTLSVDMKSFSSSTVLNSRRLDSFETASYS